MACKNCYALQEQVGILGDENLRKFNQINELSQEVNEILAERNTLKEENEHLQMELNTLKNA